eukprot:TRINITY_DN1278_c11_g1_i1.p1 TRINITY_DN1278_c11_g1~~TRINITY_DN1278_c11_g1_i1.p1  ORF type:complete len:192 (+),score=70.30 TRINITY_DN1278_c11_g1_i1:58-633(+)
MSKVQKTDGAADHADAKKETLLAKVKAIVDAMLKKADIDEAVKNCDSLKGHPTVMFEAHVEDLTEASVMGNAGTRNGNECDYDVDCEDFLDLDLVAEDDEDDNEDDHEKLREDLEELDVDYFEYMAELIRAWIKENIIPKVRAGSLKDAKEFLFYSHDGEFHYNIETGEKLNLDETGDDIEEDEEDDEKEE